MLHNMRVDNERSI